MFQSNHDSNTISYIITSEHEEIFVNMFYDKEFFIVKTHVSVVKIKDKKDIYHGLKNMDTDEYIGVLGTYNAISTVVSYMNKHKDEKLFYESDIMKFTTTIFNDMISVRNRCKELVDENKSFINRTNMNKFMEKYYG